MIYTLFLFTISPTVPNFYSVVDLSSLIVAQSTLLTATSTTVRQVSAAVATESTTARDAELQNSNAITLVSRVLNDLIANHSLVVSNQTTAAIALSSLQYQTAQQTSALQAHDASFTSE